MGKHSFLLRKFILGSVLTVMGGLAVQGCGDSGNTGDGAGDIETNTWSVRFTKTGNSQGLPTLDDPLTNDNLRSDCRSQRTTSPGSFARVTCKLANTNNVIDVTCNNGINQGFAQAQNCAVMYLRCDPQNGITLNRCDGPQPAAIQENGVENE